METAVAPERTGKIRLQPHLLWAVLIGLGAAGIALKTPFGHFLMHVMGKSPPATQQTFSRFLFASEWGWLSMAAIATLLLYRRSGLSPAPRLERLLFREARTSAPPRFWLPVLLGGGVCLLFFVVHTVLGLGGQLTGQMGFGHLSHADQMRLASLYPLADIGAGLSEEVVFRFGLLTSLMALMSYARLGGQDANNNTAFWIANIVQAALFGYIHVQQGIVTTQLGGVFLATAMAPPTWAGLTLGYVYRRWGIESAFGAHMAGDIFVPAFWVAWAQLHH